jgi:GxxExxY protein
MQNTDLTGRVIGAAIRVHRALGPGLLESAYEACMKHVLRREGLRVDSQVPMPIKFEDTFIEVGYRIDLLVEQQVVVELKAVSKVLPIHEAQILSQIRLGDFRVGLLLNFNVPRMREGIIRYAN